MVASHQEEGVGLVVVGEAVLIVVIVVAIGEVTGLVTGQVAAAVILRVGGKAAPAMAIAACLEIMTGLADLQVARTGILVGVTGKSIFTPPRNLNWRWDWY
jgi:hypothetical protein